MWPTPIDPHAQRTTPESWYQCLEPHSSTSRGWDFWGRQRRKTWLIYVHYKNTKSKLYTTGNTHSSFQHGPCIQDSQFLRLSPKNSFSLHYPILLTGHFLSDEQGYKLSVLPASTQNISQAQKTWVFSSGTGHWHTPVIAGELQEGTRNSL